MMQDPKAHGPALFRLCKLMRMQQHPLLSAVESAERNAALLCKAFLIKSRMEMKSCKQSEPQATDQSNKL